MATTAIASVSLLLCDDARAQRWSVEAGVGSQLTWSSNPQLGIGGSGDDTILDVRPHIRVRAEGARLKVTGSAALNAITTANGTQDSRVLPEADLGARLEAVERFFFIEAGLRALQTSQDPFGPRPEAATNLNALTTAQARFSPIIESAIDADTRYRLRSDNTWTRESGADGLPTIASAEGYFGRHAVAFERDPRPFGWSVEAERSETRYRESAQDDATFDLARLSMDYAFGSDLTAGLRVGRERTSLLPAEDQERNIVGAQATWRPSPRTALSVFREKRFFGSSWRLDFNHRLPFLAWNIRLSRALDSAPQALFELPATDNVTGLLDAMFTSRIPDAVERAKAVDDFIARQGLPTQTLRPVNVHAQRMSLVTLRSANVVFNGVRNSLTVGAFQSQIEDVSRGGALVAASALTNNRQHGASAALAHRLSPTMAMTVSTDWSRIRALAGIERSIERSARLRLSVQATPKTTAFTGVRYRELDSNVTAAGREGAVFAGLDHTF